MTRLAVPSDATFRRSEGLTFLLEPCAGLHTAGVTVQRFSGPEHHRLPMAEAALLGRMSRWLRADELAVSHGTLVSLVERHLAFWAEGRPTRDLTGAPLPQLDGHVALVRNAMPKLLMHQDGRTSLLPFMPRAGALDGMGAIGLELTVMEMGLDTHTVGFQCCGGHGALLRDLLPRLDGRHHVDELTATPDVRPILEAMSSLGLLERYQPPVWDGRAQLTWLGHAGVLYEAAGKRVLIDPSQPPCSYPSRESSLPPDLRDLGVIDVVLITHGDNDHLNPGALSRLPRDTKIVVPRADPQPYQVDIDGLLRLLGFEHIFAVDPWEVLELGAVRIVAAPFRGEDWGLSLATCTYLVTSPELTIYANADSAFMPDVYTRIAEQHSIDVAFLGISGAAEAYVAPPRYGYGHFYQPWIPAERESQWIQLCSGPEEAAEAARLLRARRAVGYAAGGASYHQLAYCDRGTHADLARLLVASGASIPLDLPIGKAVRTTDWR